MGGHAEALLETSGSGVRLLGLDADPEALRQAGPRLARFGARARLVHASFANLGAVAAREGVDEAQAILFDLGISSWQLDESGRGFSFQREEEPLDMRMDPTQGETAVDLLNQMSEADLADLLYAGGEDRHARRIARVIVRRRPLATTGDLVAAVRAAVPAGGLAAAARTWRRARFRPCAWQVNDEAGALGRALDAGPRLLAAAVVSA
jgi:16S rRNA (cytosine1402-N4)-methyltransferase